MSAMVVHAVCVTLCVTVVAATFGPDYTVCNVTHFLQQAKLHNGSTRPDLPDRWSVRIEANILEQSYSMDMLEYYDFISNRAALEYWMESVHYKAIFLYDSNELITVMYDDSSPRCHVDDLAKTSVVTNTFRMTRFANGTERIWPAHLALRFGGDAPEVPHLQAEAKDGITVDSWKSCSYIPDEDTTLLIERQFPASNGWRSAVTAAVPVKVTLKGVNHVNSTYAYHINNEYFFTDFQTTIPVDAFTTPSNVYCSNRKSTLKIPTVPSSFSVSSETVEPQRLAVQWRQFSYDDDLHLMRTYYTPDVNLPSPYGHNQLMYIRDFNTALTYTVDTEQGNCTVNQIPDGYNGIDDQPEANLFRQRDFTFVGQNMSRGIRCDVFQFMPPNLAKPNSTTELFIAAREWKEITGSNFTYGIPVRMEVTKHQNGDKTIYNFYDYRRDQHDIWKTDLSSCFESSQKYDFIIVFTRDHVAEVLADRDSFIQNFVTAVYKQGNMSPMQISNVQITPTSSNINAKFSYTYQDESPSQATTMLHMTVDHSQALLYSAIDANTFVIHLGQNKTLLAIDIIRVN